MKVLILAGGYGSRIGELTQYRPKPMIELGHMPILVHIMKHYAHYGYNDFVILAGYKQDVIKEYFANYYLNSTDVTFDFTEGKNDIILHKSMTDKWKVTIADTGLDVMTGGRIKRARDYIGDEPFMLTYGDGVSDLNLKELEEYHKSHGKLVTLSCCNVAPKFGTMDLAEDGSVMEFREKVAGDSNLVNIGYMVCQPEFLDYIEGDQTMLERAPLEQASRDGELMAYKHTGFWQCMDTIREKEILEKLWADGDAPWKVWK